MASAAGAAGEDAFSMATLTLAGLVLATGIGAWCSGDSPTGCIARCTTATTRTLTIEVARPGRYACSARLRQEKQKPLKQGA